MTTGSDPAKILNEKWLSEAIGDVARVEKYDGSRRSLNDLIITEPHPTSRIAEQVPRVVVRESTRSRDPASSLSLAQPPLARPRCDPTERTIDSSRADPTDSHRTGLCLPPIRPSATGSPPSPLGPAPADGSLGVRSRSRLTLRSRSLATDHSGRAGARRTASARSGRLVSAPAGNRRGLRAVGAHPTTLTPLDARAGPRCRALPAPRAPESHLGVGSLRSPRRRRDGAGGWLSH